MHPFSYSSRFFFTKQQTGSVICLSIWCLFYCKPRAKTDETVCIRSKNNLRGRHQLRITEFCCINGMKKGTLSLLSVICDFLFFFLAFYSMRLDEVPSLRSGTSQVISNGCRNIGVKQNLGWNRSMHSVQSSVRTVASGCVMLGSLTRGFFHLFPLLQSELTQKSKEKSLWIKWIKPRKVSNIPQNMIKTKRC